MRTAQVLAIGLGVLFGGVSIADTDLGSETDELKSKMTFLMTPDGDYLALAQTEARNHVFFGKDRDLYRQRVLISATDEDDSVSILIWAPSQPRDATLEERDEKWWLRCGENEVELTAVDRDEREVLISSVRFHKPRFTRQPYALARNKRGEYYYVDRESGSEGNEGFSMYVGRAGKASKQKLAWVVSDSEGDVFATRRGELRITRENDLLSMVWRPKKKKKKSGETLLAVPLGQNSSLIYKQLGVYENQSFGTPCDSDKP